MGLNVFTFLILIFANIYLLIKCSLGFTVVTMLPKEVTPGF